MNVVTLHVLSSGPSADFGLVRLAAPALEPQARVLLFDGLPPPPLPDIPGIAPVVLQGDVDNHRAYAEQITEGVTIKRLSVPAEVRAWVGKHLLDALLALHAAGQSHGLVSADRVLLGVDGSVTLFGRGRVGGSAEHDLKAATGLLSRIGIELNGRDLTAARRALEGRIAEEDAEILGAVVADNLPEQSIVDQVYVHVGPTPDSLDEVVPDFGPDKADGRGLLDRWSVTTHAGQDEATDELTGSAASSTSPLALTLWTSLAAPPAHRPPPDRFDKVAGQPSRGMRALLIEEPPDSLPAMVGGAIDPFLLQMPEPTMEPTPVTIELTDPELTPARDEDPATAVYHLRDLELRSVIEEADTKTVLADLRARISEAEERASQAERRARAAEAELRRMTVRPAHIDPAPLIPRIKTPPTAPIAGQPIPAPAPPSPTAPALPRWFRPELLVLLLLVAMIAFMAWWVLT